MTVNYRESFGLHAIGDFFNHESPLRGIEFVTRKITDGVARIKLGLAPANCTWAIWMLDATGVMHAIMCALCGWCCTGPGPDDYVVATGRTVSIREFCQLAFGHAGLIAEEHVRVSQSLIRPAEVDVLQGNASKAHAALGWQPEISLEAMVAEMVEADLRAASVPDGGLSRRVPPGAVRPPVVLQGRERLG